MTSPQDLRGQSGSKVVIPCQAVGDPEPVISWMFNGKEITFDEDEDEARVYTQLTSGNLRIESFSAPLMGDYQCKAANMMGETLSRPARMSMAETSSSQVVTANQRTTGRGPAPSTTTTTAAPTSPVSPGQLHFNHVSEDVTIPLNDSIILDCPERGK